MTTTRHRPRPWQGAAAILLAAAVTAGIARAQSPGGFSHDTSQPIDVSADELEVREEGNTAIFSGDVEAVQGKLELYAEEVRVYYRGQGGDGTLITRIDADGAVTITTPEEEASGDWAIYDVDQRIVTLGGNVQIRRGDNVLTGQRLVVDLTGGPSRLDGAGPGGDRVKGRFKPSEAPGGDGESGE